jgi:hypothetical protein
MVHVNIDQRIIFVKGPVRYRAIEEAVCVALGVKAWRNRGEWLVVGLADEESKVIITGNAFDPPIVEREPIGFKKWEKQR